MYQPPAQTLYSYWQLTLIHTYPHLVLLNKDQTHQSCSSNMTHHVDTFYVTQVCGISVVYCCLGPPAVPQTPPADWLSVWSNQFSSNQSGGSQPTPMPSKPAMTTLYDQNSSLLENSLNQQPTNSSRVGTIVGSGISHRIMRRLGINLRERCDSVYRPPSRLTSSLGGCNYTGFTLQ